MEQEGPINFRALRARFQEEASQAQARSRPAIAEKPKSLPPPPGGHCSSLVTSLHAAVENKVPVAPRVFFRDGTRVSGGRRPFSFPPNPPDNPCPCPPRGAGEGEGKGTARSLRDLPLVLPAPPREHKTATEQPNEAPPPPTKCKKGPPPPFKSTKSFKFGGDSGGDPVRAELTGKPLAEDGGRTEVEVSLRGDRSTPERGPPSSPDAPLTPPSAGPGGDSPPGAAGAARVFDQRVLSTLEKLKAKRRFSPKQLLIYAKPKSSPRANGAQLPHGCSVGNGGHPPPEGGLPPPPPVCHPHLACVAVRPFVKMNGSVRKPEATLERRSYWAHVDPPSPVSSPPRRPLPGLPWLGPLPVKPPRPPWVDLSSYQPTTQPDKEFAAVAERVPDEEPQSNPPLVLNPELEAPEFPDFDNSEMETAEGGDFDIAALEFEARDLGDAPPPAPPDSAVPDFVAPAAAELPVYEALDPGRLYVQALDLIDHQGAPPDPPYLPEPLVLHDPPGPPDSPLLPDPPVLAELLVLEDERVPASVPEPPGEAEQVSVEPSVTEDTDHGSEPSLDADAPLPPSVCLQENYYEACDNVYEDVENIKKFIIKQNSQKRKTGPKNPYSDSHPTKEETRNMNIWPRNACKERHSPENHEDREQKKREKQRLERQKKEQKEREKKENEMKKKYKVSGQEEALYHAMVKVTSKVRKNDLPVKTGDAVSIIRTTNCPKGKWLARDSDRKYGYISVMNVELNIKEMLELGKRASQAAGRGADGDTVSIGSRSSHPRHMVTSSFTDDSDEWTCEDETQSFSTESCIHNRTSTLSMPENFCGHAGAQHTLSDASLEDLHTQNRHEALQKLAIFFQHNKDGFSDIAENGEQTPTNENPSFLCAVEEPPYLDEEVDFVMDVDLLPPPDLYADTLIGGALAV